MARTANRISPAVDRPRARRPVALIVAALLTAGASACDTGVFEPEVPSEVLVFLDLMNDHRVSVGCEQLTWRDDIAEVAQAHALDMQARDYFAHTNPEGDSPFDRLSNAGISYSRAAENIAWGYPSADAVLQAWLASAGHRANLENCDLTRHGVGLEGTHWTHLFMTP